MKSSLAVATLPTTLRGSVNAGDVDHSTTKRDARSARLQTTALASVTAPDCTPHGVSGVPALAAANAPARLHPTSAADNPTASLRRPSL